MNNYHVPILLKQVINGLNIISKGVYVDMTYGSGGYSRAILNSCKDITVIAFDCDKDAMQNKINDERLYLFHSNYRFFNNFLEYLNISQVDGIVVDLGVSSHQFDTASRGFSFRFDSKLDLRMNAESKITAEDVINKYQEEKLTQIFYNYGEIPFAEKISRAIVNQRNLKKISTTYQLVEILNPFAQKGKEHKFFAKVFQALRIEVNDEINALKEMLIKSLNFLKPKSRMCIVTYHSLEDSIVKNFFRSGNFNGKIEKDIKGNPVQTPFIPVNKKPIIPDENEIKENNRARSAKLRIAEKL
jgi:16S rRNA (cytosine1402-N4)-methyltransferase